MEPSIRHGTQHIDWEEKSTWVHKGPVCYLAGQ